MIISEAIRQVIATGPLAHLTTPHADGSPQVAVVWVGSDGDECVSGHIGVWPKVTNARRDPRVALSLRGRGTKPLGLPADLVVDGAARLPRLAKVSIGPESRVPRSRAAADPATWRGSRRTAWWASARGIRRHDARGVDTRGPTLVSCTPNPDRPCLVKSHTTSVGAWRGRNLPGDPLGLRHPTAIASERPALLIGVVALVSLAWHLPPLVADPRGLGSATGARPPRVHASPETVGSMSASFMPWAQSRLSHRYSADSPSATPDMRPVEGRCFARAGQGPVAHS
jgi:predicted pyridoxine 5'-phosphate oxidase superfamily flavin-nucleotide-binding protein